LGDKFLLDEVQAVSQVIGGWDLDCVGRGELEVWVIAIVGKEGGNFVASYATLLYANSTSPK
jgi:hypothetical protein